MRGRMYKVLFLLAVSHVVTFSAAFLAAVYIEERNGKDGR